MRRKAKQNKSSMVCITLLSLAVAGVMSVQMVSLYEKNQDYRDRKKQLEADLEDEQLRQDELKEREEYIQRNI
jgi:cell division protein DivIC